MDARIGIANSLAAECGRRPQVEAVALGGSLAGETAAECSDVDLYVCLTDVLPLETRAAIARARADCVEAGSDFWESGDEWIEWRDGLHLDGIYRKTGWAENWLDRRLHREQPAQRRHPDRPQRRLRGVQRVARAPYPEKLAGRSWPRTTRT